MPMTPQEQHCVNLVLEKLAVLYGGEWQLQTDNLDDQYPSEPSPECIVANGDITAAIEVKRLIGGSATQTYVEAKHSLERFLAPDCNGYFMLGPAVDLRVPIALPLRRWLRKEIESVAQKLSPGEKGAISIPRDAMLSCTRLDGADFVCSHNGTIGLIRSLVGPLPGMFFLRDQGQLEHEFVTETGKAAFREALLTTCRSCRPGYPVQFEWREEWSLWRGRESGADDDDERGLDVLCATDAYHVDQAVEECANDMVLGALRKFEHRRWGDRQVIILDKEDYFCDEQRVTAAIRSFDSDSFRNVDAILLADGDASFTIWRRGEE